jgi:hypothetical protein
LASDRAVAIMAPQHTQIPYFWQAAALYKSKHRVDCHNA